MISSVVSRVQWLRERKRFWELGTAQEHPAIMDAMVGAGIKFILS